MEQKIKLDLIASMKARDALRTLVLRMMLSELNYKKIDLGHDLTDADVVSVIQKEVKKRKEAMVSYQAGGRLDLAENEEKELGILMGYMPEQLTEEQVKQELKMLIEQVSDKQFSSVMKEVSPKFKGRADGGLVAKLVKELLQG